MEGRGRKKEVSEEEEEGRDHENWEPTRGHIDWRDKHNFGTDIPSLLPSLSRSDSKSPYSAPASPMTDKLRDGDRS